MAEKNSVIGKASFIISIIAGIFILLSFIVAMVVEESTPGGMDEESAALIGCSMFIFLFADVVAIGLGIGGMCKKNCNKLLAILGTCFSTAAILITILLILIGFTMG